jgi:hypothetical protein
MTADPFKAVRNHLRLAAGHLAGSERRISTLRGRVLAVEHQLDPTRPVEWHGDPQPACSELEDIVAALKRCTHTPPARASGFDKLRQDPRKTLLPGVAEAIGQLMKAVELLKAMRSPEPAVPNA